MSKSREFKVKIRQETPADYLAVSDVVRIAFESATHTNGREFVLVADLRRSKDFIPQLSLVAETDGKIVGHILFSKIQIVAESGASHSSLALAPVAVLPDFQKRKIGRKLIERGHEVAKSLGFDSVIVLGHPTYYPSFGYKKASLWKIRSEWNVPDEVFMALELGADSLRNVSGVVKYPSEFGG